MLKLKSDLLKVIDSVVKLKEIDLPAKPPLLDPIQCK